MKAPATALAPLVDQLPEDWSLLAVNGEKVPINASNGKFQDGWTLRSESRELLKISRHVKAVGVVCGPLSGGLIAMILMANKLQTVWPNSPMALVKLICLPLLAAQVASLIAKNCSSLFQTVICTG